MDDVIAVPAGVGGGGSVGGVAGPPGPKKVKKVVPDRSHSEIISLHFLIVDLFMK